MKLPRPVTEIWTANRLENGAARERAIVNHAGHDVPEAPSREAQIAQAAAPTTLCGRSGYGAEQCGYIGYAKGRKSPALLVSGAKDDQQCSRKEKPRSAPSQFGSRRVVPEENIDRPPRRCQEV
jgi:hypothetical protein